MAIVDEESTDSYSWFLRQLADGGLRGYLRMPELVIVSDRHAGLRAALEDQTINFTGLHR
jgi:hypothetical protein